MGVHYVFLLGSGNTKNGHNISGNLEYSLIFLRYIKGEYLHLVFHCDAWRCSSEDVWGALLATPLEINSEFKDTLLSTMATTASCCDTPSHLVWAQMLDFFFFFSQDKTRINFLFL